MTATGSRSYPPAAGYVMPGRQLPGEPFNKVSTTSLLYLLQVGSTDVMSATVQCICHAD